MLIQLWSIEVLSMQVKMCNLQTDLLKELRVVDNYHSFLQITSIQ